MKEKKGKNNMKIVSTVEARMTSSRLPGKVLKPIMGKPMLELLIERLRHAKFVDEVVIATTVNNADMPIVELCNRLGVSVYRGSEDDVLERVLKAATFYKADLIVEMTGDCPLLDPGLVDQVIRFYLDNDYDYVSNVLHRTFPRGLDTQVFARAVLDEVDKATQDPADRENVSLYIYEHPERYKLGNVYAPEELKWPDLRICVDTIDDFNLVSRVFEELYPKDKFFSACDMVALIKHLGLDTVNAHVKQKAAR